MLDLLKTSGEIDLLSDDDRVITLDGLEDWQVDVLLRDTVKAESTSSVAALINVDYVVTDWVADLTPEQWRKIARQKSLYGIPVPKEWIKVWRCILREPELRDPGRATKNGRGVGTYTHIWNLWSQDCIEKYTADIEKELLGMVDEGWLYEDIGEVLSAKYGDEFWKKRSEKSTTLPAQVVNNYLHTKMPTKIVRGELLDLALKRLRKAQENRCH